MTKSSKDDDSIKNSKKKKSKLPSIFSRKGKNGRSQEEEAFPPGEIIHDLERRYMTRRSTFVDSNPVMRKSFSDRQTSSHIEGLNLSTFDRTRQPSCELQEFR